MNTYCSSMYGLVLMPLTKTDKIQVIWRKAMRQIWKLPYRTHSILLRCLPDTICDKHLVLSRFSKFILSVIQRKSQIFNYAIRCFMRNDLSLLRQNAQKCCELLGVDLGYFSTFTGGRIHVHLTKNCQDQCKNAESVGLSKALYELTFIRDGQADCRTLSRSEILETIDYICIN